LAFKIIFGILSLLIRSTCPNHLILIDLIKFTMSSCPIIESISLLVLILQLSSFLSCSNLHQ
jgi:hypothetical protein